MKFYEFYVQTRLRCNEYESDEHYLSRSGKIQASTGFEPMTGMYALSGVTHDVKLLHSIGTMGTKSTGKKHVV